MRGGERWRSDGVIVSDGATMTAWGMTTTNCQLAGIAQPTAANGQLLDERACVCKPYDCICVPASDVCFAYYMWAAPFLASWHNHTMFGITTVHVHVAVPLKLCKQKSQVQYMVQYSTHISKVQPLTQPSTKIFF